MGGPRYNPRLQRSDLSGSLKCVEFLDPLPVEEIQALRKFLELLAEWEQKALNFQEAEI
jgi:hypothetical protein